MNENFTAAKTTFEGELQDSNVRIRVIGVGGAGSNVVDRLKLDQMPGVYLSVVNCDIQALQSSLASEKVLIGRGITRGLGSGGDSEIGRQAVQEDEEKIVKLVEGMELVFLITGLGGGLGSGASPLIAEHARKAGALVISFVTLPFTFEGARRYQLAEESLGKLREQCHAVIPLPNDILLQQSADDASVLDAFSQADLWIQGGVRSIWTMLNRTGLINLDFAALKGVFSSLGGKTLFGIAEGKGEHFVEQALDNLMQCPLLHLPEYSRRADSLLVNLIGGPDLGMAQVNTIMGLISEKFCSRENTLLGAVIEEEMAQTLQICVIGCSDMGNDRYRKSGKKSFTSAGAGSNGHSAVPVSRNIAAPELEPDQKLREIPLVPRVDFQHEFDFTREELQKGYFDKSGGNLWEGQDLDLPTFLRRGVKIHQ